MINLEAEDAFAAAVPSRAQSTNFGGGSSSTLLDTATDQGWLEIDQNGNQVLPFNYINAPSDSFGLTMNSVDQIWLNNIITLVGINVSGGPVPTLNIIENVTIGSIVNTKGPNTLDLDISNVLTEISSPLFSRSEDKLFSKQPLSLF